MACCVVHPPSLALNVHSHKCPQILVLLWVFQCVAYKPFDLIGYKFLSLVSECYIQFVRFMGVVGWIYFWFLFTSFSDINLLKGAHDTSRSFVLVFRW